MNDQTFRTVLVRVKNTNDKQFLIKNLKSYRHFENMIILLIKNNQEDFKYFSDYKTIRAVVTETSGGQAKEKVNYIVNKYKDDQLLKDLIETGKSLKEHNLSMVVRRVRGNYKTFFTNIKTDPEVRPPKTKKLNKLNHMTVPLDANAWTLKRKNSLGITLNHKVRYFHINHEQILQVIHDFNTVKAVSVHFSNGEVYLEIHYSKNVTVPDSKQVKESGLDLGVNNLGALFINDKDSTSLILSGTIFKKYNNDFNRRLSKLNEEISKDKENNTLKKKKSRLYENRNMFFMDHFHKYSKFILNYLQSRDVTDLYVSKNILDLKNNGKLNLGSRNNQNFVYIPFGKFLDYLIYKSFEYGVTIHVIDEAYTSKISCVTEDVTEFQKYSFKVADGFNGSRVKRGIFKDRKVNKIWNADLNGAVNHVKVGNSSLDFSWLTEKLFKLCNPVKVKSDWEFFKFLKNTVSDKFSLGEQRLKLSVC